MRVARETIEFSAENVCRVLHLVVLNPDVLRRRVANQQDAVRRLQNGEKHHREHGTPVAVERRRRRRRGRGRRRPLAVHVRVSAERPREIMTNESERLIIMRNEKSQCSVFRRYRLHFPC